MKKLKLFMFVALFGAMSFGAFTAYDYATMSEEERFLLANVEALTRLEPGGGDKTGSLYTNADGSYYCCKRDGNPKSCGALDC